MNTNTYRPIFTLISSGVLPAASIFSNSITYGKNMEKKGKINNWNDDRYDPNNDQYLFIFTYIYIYYDTGDEIDNTNDGDINDYKRKIKVIIIKNPL